MIDVSSSSASRASSPEWTLKRPTDQQTDECATDKARHTLIVADYSKRSNYSPFRAPWHRYETTTSCGKSPSPCPRSRGAPVALSGRGVVPRTAARSSTDGSRRCGTYRDPKATGGALMPANDQLTALDAAFLELEEADDSALMHIGAALVFDPRPGRWDAGDRGGARAARTALGPVASLPPEARRAPHRRTRLAVLGARSAL